MHKLGEIIPVKIVSIRIYGLFVVDETGRKGLIHVSECDVGYVKDLSRAFSVGDEIRAIVMEDDGGKMFSLSIRSLKETDGKLSQYPLPESLYVQRKKYWTKMQHNTGFVPLKEVIDFWKREKLK